MTRRSVDFPQPDGPMSEMNSPRPDLEIDVLERGDAALSERLRDAPRGDDRLGDAHTSCSGGAVDDELLHEHDDEEERDAEQRRDEVRPPRGSPDRARSTG